MGIHVGSFVSIERHVSDPHRTAGGARVISLAIGRHQGGEVRIIGLPNNGPSARVSFIGAIAKQHDGLIDFANSVDSDEVAGSARADPLDQLIRVGLDITVAMDINRTGVQVQRRAQDNCQNTGGYGTGKKDF